MQRRPVMLKQTWRLLSLSSTAAKDCCAGDFQNERADLYQNGFQLFRSAKVRQACAACMHAFVAAWIQVVLLPCRFYNIHAA